MWLFCIFVIFLCLFVVFLHLFVVLLCVFVVVHFQQEMLETLWAPGPVLGGPAQKSIHGTRGSRRTSGRWLVDLWSCIAGWTYWIPLLNHLREGLKAAGRSEMGKICGLGMNRAILTLIMVRWNNEWTWAAAPPCFLLELKDDGTPEPTGAFLENTVVRYRLLEKPYRGIHNGIHFRLAHHYFELFNLSAEARRHLPPPKNLLKNGFTKPYRSVTTDEYLKIALPLCVSPLLWIDNSFILSIIEMHGAWGDLVGFNFLVRYEYKYKPKDIRSPFIYKHMYSFQPVLTETYLSLKYSTHPSIKAILC